MDNLKKCFFAFLVLLFLQPNGPAAQQKQNCSDFSSIEKDIKEYIAKYIEANKIPGLSIAIYKDNYSWNDGFGYSDIGNSVKANSNTVYNIASITKPMTATAILKLALDGKINLDDKIQKYVPYYPEKEWPISIRQLLGHIGGISGYKDGFAELVNLRDKHLSMKESIEIFNKWDLVAEPGTKYVYSNYGYQLLGAVIEAASGMSYGEYINNIIWKPLKMDRAYIDDPYYVIPNKARGYILKRNVLNYGKFLDPSLLLSAGGVASTAVDLVKFAKGLDSGAVLPIEIQSQMYNSMTTKNGEETLYGMGWQTNFYFGYWQVWHTGLLDGFRTLLWRFPWNNFAVAITCNLENAFLDPIAHYICSKYLHTFNLRPVTKSAIDNISMSGLWTIWWSGLSYFDRYNLKSVNDDETIKKDFQFIKKALSEELALSGSNPQFLEKGFTPIINVGSYIAECLKNEYGIEKINYYREGNIFSFFSDYIKLYKNKKNIKNDCHFDEALENNITLWKLSWDKIKNNEINNQMLMPLNNFNNDLILNMEACFKNQKAYPDFEQQLNNYVYYLKGKKQLKSGLDALLIAVELYPYSANLFDSTAEFYEAMNLKDKAIEYYEKALKISPNLSSSLQGLKRLKSASN